MAEDDTWNTVDVSNTKEEVEYDTLVNEVDDLEHYKPKHKIGHYVLSEDDLIKLQEKAVESYDNKRKERKKEKQA